MTRDAETAALEVTLDAVLPVGLRFDGIQHFPFHSLVQFTELDQSVESYGATFYVELKGFTLGKAIRCREEKRREFKAGQRVAA